MQLTPEQINEFVAQAVLESALGQEVQASIERVMKSFRNTHDNPFDSVIRAHANQIIDKELQTTYRPVLEAGIKTAMTKIMTDETLDKIIQAATEKLRSHY